MNTKLGTIKEQVAQILENYPETRANDNILIRTYFAKYYGIILPLIEGTVSWESISRSRRWWQQRGEYLPLEDSVIEGRALAEKEYKEVFRQKNSPNRVSSF